MTERRRPLSRDRVLRAALDLVDREGVDALTMRRLGRELGVEAMSLYGYVENKQDLIEGVVEQVFRQMPLIGPGPGLWQDRIRRHASTYRAVLLAHPHAVRLIGGRPLVTEGTATFVELALAELVGIGLDLIVADRVLGVIGAFTLGQVAEQVGDIVRDDDAEPGPPPGSKIADPTRFPRLAAVGEMKPADYDEQFELGLDFIVAGIERLLAQRGGAGDDSGYDRIIG
jgi:TetR/AcrR family tetracycline transcriptional repressor